MSVSRDRLAPGQSRVSTASAFGRIGFLLAAVLLSVPRTPAVAAAAEPIRAAPLQVMAPAPHRLACLVIDPKSKRCDRSSAVNGTRTG